MQDVQTVARIERLGLCPAENGKTGPVMVFRVTFLGEEALPGAVEVGVKLVTRWRAGLSRRWVRDVLKYVPRSEDLWPGSTGFCVQRRRSQIYRFELNDSPRAFWDPKALFDFSKHERVELTVRAVTQDKSATERTFSFSLKEAKHETADTA